MNKTEADGEDGGEGEVGGEVDTGEVLGADAEAAAAEYVDAIKRSNSSSCTFKDFTWSLFFAAASKSSYC